MIDPNNITDFNRSKEELELFLLFATVVAGKGAEQQAKKLQQFLGTIGVTEPLRYVKMALDTNTLDDMMRRVKIGQYNRLQAAWKGILENNFDLRTVTPEQLESIKGIGPKTARFFILHSQPNQKLGVLDTHVLKWIKANLDPKAPKTTPSGKRYLQLERKFIEYCETNNINIADFDLQLWVQYSNEKKSKKEKRNINS